MKLWKILAVMAAIGVALPASAQVRVRGYTTKNGTYVAPHYRTPPNRTTSDNWTTQGNVNPYTGTEGTQDPAPRYRPYQPTPSYRPRATTTPCYYNCPK